MDEKDIPYIVAEPGKTYDPDPSLRILVLSPPKQHIGDSINTNSIVLRVSYGAVNLLYAGDATTEAEEVMLKAGYPLDADILKVGHHGSSDASSAAFLRRVDPDVAVISLDKDNEYGHPHRETLERLNAAGPLVLRTDRDGTVRVMSDGATYSVATEKDTVNIWSRPGTTPSLPVISRPTGLPGNDRHDNRSPVPFTLPVTLPPIPSNITVPSLTMPSLQVGNASSVYISAVQFDAPGDDTKNLNGEWVRLANRGDDAVLLTSWTLADRSSAEPYRFPAYPPPARQFGDRLYRERRAERYCPLYGQDRADLGQQRGPCYLAGRQREYH